jgi:hypothetical protein
VLITSYDAIQLKKRGLNMRVMTWRARFISPRRRMSLNSRKEDSKCVSMTWRAVSMRVPAQRSSDKYFDQLQEAQAEMERMRQGLTLLHFSPQPVPLEV